MSEEDKTQVDPPSRTKLGVGGVTPKSRPDLIGRTVLDRYLIEAELGAGAMGAVYRGRHTKLRRPVAIKVLHDRHAGEPVIVERFRREALVVAKLAHANVVGVLDVGETSDGHQVIVLEFVDGPSLRKVMAGPMEPARIIRLVKPILRGLEHAHANKLIHRDLKPDNVIVETSTDGSEVPRIVDFGIAALRDPDDSIQGGKLTASGVIIGTPLYMAPEMAQGEAFDHRVDLFALGVMIYEMLAGTVPFVGSAIDIALANISKDPPRIRDRAGIEVDPLLERYARKLMARKLPERLATARAALDLLEQIERDPETAAIALGQVDVLKAMAAVSLPEPPKSKK